MMNRPNITTYEEAVAYLLDTPRFTAKNSIESTRAFLHTLGDPDRQLPCIIHVAGTNGKGSVCAYLRSIFETAGSRVAVFTSPHLQDIRERFVIAGEMVTKEAFLCAFLKVYQGIELHARTTADASITAPPAGEDGAGAVGGKEPYHPTFFEYLFFMAMLLFAKEKPDICILETGLGGRLDATNAVSHKELCVLTHISLDHTQYLGNTIAAIAGEKAGILAPGVPVVYPDAVPEAEAVFAARAQELACPRMVVRTADLREVDFKNKFIAFSICSEYYEYSRLILHTIAGYQVENAALAVAAVELFRHGQGETSPCGIESEVGCGLRLPTREEVAVGLSHAFWPGRMEEIRPEVYLDGAHNEDGVRAFLEAVAHDGCTQGRRLLFGVSSDKDREQMVGQIARSGLFDAVGAVPMQSARSVSLEELETVFAHYPELTVVYYRDVESALQREFEEHQAGGRFYIAGSLYLVGEVKEYLENDSFRRRA